MAVKHILILAGIYAVLALVPLGLNEYYIHVLNISCYYVIISRCDEDTCQSNISVVRDWYIIDIFFKRWH